jgi:hypothetical protein
MHVWVNVIITIEKMAILSPKRGKIADDGDHM